MQEGKAPSAGAGLYWDFVCGDVTMHWARTGPDGWENQPVAPCTHHGPRPQGRQRAAVGVWSLLCRKLLTCQASRTRSRAGSPGLTGRAALVPESLKKEPLSHFLLF